ncbi:MAG: CCA tRNA nucleotidyltransferase [Planctomycetia bacterium]|nr:CCA tRNA nucleotidyltransferase [Planctomycetia bacterium]
MTTLDQAEQRRFALEVLSQLRAAGHVAYWAGGCVRDELLQRKPKDYDVATSARPEEIRTLFGHRRTLAIGEAFGVIAVLGPKSAGMVEATTFRRDAGYSDGRRPDAVEFTDAEEDARRRDFTMNALFFDPIENRVIDYVGGQADITRRVVRAVGDARARFHEDKLRMLRAVRMASRFGFALDSETAEALRAAAHEITLVSPERIAQEMRAMCGLPGQTEAARLLKETCLIDAILPELQPLQNGANQAAWEQTLAVLAELERGGPTSFGLGLAALLHTVGEAWTVGEVARRWRLSNAEREHAAWLVGNQQRLAGAQTKPWSTIQPVLARPEAPDLVALVEALQRVAGRPLDDVAFCRAKLALPRDELDPPPLVTGNDLIAAGLKPGREFSRLLDLLRAAQLDGQVHSPEDALALARQLSGD